jgi:CheY-like chemotaxis protein
VDDNIDILAITQLLLEKADFVVRVAEDAPTALNILTTFQPNLILMDIQLQGMDGLELTRQIRQIPRLEQVPIVAFSACATKVDEENAQAAGCEGYITKPIDVRTFVSSICKHLATSGLSK